MKRSSTGTLAVAVLLLLGMAAALTNLTRTAGGTSVLLLTIDTTRADHLGCYGYAKARTPALDGLAAEGALFEDATTPSPLTLPAHATLLTGLLPPRHGLRDNDTPFPLPPAARRTFRTAAETFGEAGWQTAAFVSGSSLSSRWGLDAGFASWEQPAEAAPGSLQLGERIAGDTVGRALGWLGRRDRSRPFLLWVHLFDPHHPYAAPGGGGHPADSVEAYDEEIAYADRQVARLLDALHEEGVLDRTVIVACSDHGEGLGEHGETTHGFFLHRSTIRVPLLVRAPGAVKPGTRVKDPVSLADVTPTLYDLLQRKTPVPLDGRSLLPLLSPKGGTAPPPSDQYAETLYGWRSFRWAQSVAVRNGSRRILDHGGDRRQVYDLAADPGETADLGASPPAPGDGPAVTRAWDLFRSPPLAPPPGDPPLGGYGVPAHSLPSRPPRGTRPWEERGYRATSAPSAPSRSCRAPTTGTCPFPPPPASSPSSWPRDSWNGRASRIDRVTRPRPCWSRPAGSSRCSRRRSPGIPRPPSGWGGPSGRRGGSPPRGPSTPGGTPSGGSSSPSGGASRTREPCPS